MKPDFSISVNNSLRNYEPIASFESDGESWFGTGLQQYDKNTETVEKTRLCPGSHASRCLKGDWNRFDFE